MNHIDEINQRIKNLTSDQQIEILDILRSWQAGEQRAYTRIYEPMEIDVLIGDKLIQTVLTNVSASGVFIKTTRKVDTDQDVRVVFSMEGAEKPFKLDGSIVRSQPDGLAVEFKQVTPYLMQLLDEAIWQKQETPEDESLV